MEKGNRCLRFALNSNSCQLIETNCKDYHFISRSTFIENSKLIAL